MDNDTEDSEKKYLTFLMHVVLPRFLPQCKSDHLHAEELSLMSFMVQNAVSTNNIPPNTVKMLKGLDAMHKTLTPDAVSERIATLKPGEIFAMFVRSQNCALMIHMPLGYQSDRVVIATFPGHLGFNIISKTHRDIVYNYPDRALIVPFTGMIQSKDFAEQLYFMYNERPIETKDVKSYVEKWLTTLLTDEMSTLASTQEFPVITKKVRDAVVGEKSCDFFRRSAFYICTKVFLQQSLTVELGADRGRVLYKLVMLQFITQIIDQFNRPICKELDIDLMTQSLAKLARRMEKLSDLMKTSGLNEFDEMYGRVEMQAKTAIGKIRNKIDNQIEKLCTNDDQAAELQPLTNLDFERDVEQKMPNLLNYLEKRKNHKLRSTYDRKLQVKRIHRHNREVKVAPNLSLLKSMSSEIETTLFANDFECWVLYDFIVEKHLYSSDTLRNWIFDYVSIVDKYCVQDQMSASRMILTLLKLIAGLDWIACKEHPLLQEYRSCIDPNIIDSLLLPQKTDMRIGYALEQYFRKRNSNAQYAGLIEEASVSADSFSVKFSLQNEVMQKVLAEINDIERISCENKKREWENSRDTVEKLRRQTQGMEHAMWTNRYGRSRHDRNCRLCSVEKQIRGMKIDIYERPLPKETHERNAVVFELKCPIEISCLRDVLYCFAKLARDPKYFRFNYLMRDMRDKWISHPQNTRYCTSDSRLVMLGGRNSCTYNYKRHVDDAFVTFVPENCCTLRLGGGDSSPMSKTGKNQIKAVCTLESEFEYKRLQWTLDGTDHTQNQVISKQNECPKELSLMEFKNFGSLRADGHRLQLRKLYGMIEYEALSFNKSSVLSLVIQSLWEAGISGECGADRETHTDFTDQTFATAMIELLGRFCEQQKANWEAPNKLLVATLIAVRVFEMNDNGRLADKIVLLFDKIRCTALDWIEKITAEIKKTVIQNVQRNVDLQQKLLLVSISGAATFFINSGHEFFEKIFEGNSVNGQSAPRVWLRFVISIRNSRLFDVNKDHLPLNCRMLLRMVLYTGIHIESEVRFLISNRTEIFDDIFALAKKLWPGLTTASLERWQFHADQEQILVLEASIDGSPSYITIDIVTGEFLVNGMAVDHAPNEITSAKHFQRVFESFVFEVQPVSKTYFSTVQSYNNCYYEFVDCDNETTIIERCDREVKELIPHTILFDEFPHHLVENYSHFWNKAANTIEFRPKLFTHRNFSKKSGIEYRLDLSNRRLIHVKTERYLLDTSSDSYAQIVKQLSRLELPKHIHILMESPRIATVELIRMRLKFIVDASVQSESYDLVSNEFVRKRVCIKQKCGTLYGLEHGLLLENVPKNNSLDTGTCKMLILPHGKIHAKRSSWHVSVRINIEEDLNHPAFYQYDIDDFCRQIRASSSSCSTWFYLAYLHAVTSHGQIETFLGMSGTERSLQILQSGFAWSSEPYDDEASNILHAIADLSPKRQLKTAMEKVDWPSFIPPHSAQDSFVLIAKRLLDDSVRLKGLHVRSKEQCSSILRMTEIDCNEIQYHRHLALCPNLKLLGTFVQRDVMKAGHLKNQPTPMSRDTRLVSILYHQRKYHVPCDLNLKDFLMYGQAELDGLVNVDCIGNLLKHQTYKNFVNLWISLYVLARKGAMNDNQFGIIWSVLAHENNPLPPILALQAIEMNQQAFESIDPPNVEKYQPSEGCEFKAVEIAMIFKECHKMPDKFSSYKYNSYSTYYLTKEEINEKRAYDERLDATINEMVAKVESAFWPYDPRTCWTHVSTDIHFDTVKAASKISGKLETWSNNRKLDMFLSNVERTLKNLPQTNSEIVNVPEIQPMQYTPSQKKQKYEIDFKTKMCERLCHFQHELQEARMIWEGVSTEFHRSAQDWWDVYSNITNGQSSKHLIDAGLYPRIIPSLVLPQISSTETSELTVIIGALAVTIAHEQREKRIKYYTQSKHLEAQLDREKQCQPNLNWKPCEYPDWVLFQIEQNLCIRRIQVEVAKQMIEPQCEQHAVMQLNMGEGKTAVITPIVASQLADGKKVCQITVLKSLFATNLKSLRRYLGGMLNRRVYVFPCRRDMPVAGYVTRILKIYKECLQMKGVILTVPEHRLSFQLKIYDTIYKNDFTAAMKFLKVHDWMLDKVRNVLDESDAILHPKYQLIYTLGKQLSLDGGENRWIVIQAVLKRVSHHMRDLYNEHGAEKIELLSINYRKDVFTPCRILDPSVYEELKFRLIDDFLKGRMNIPFQGMTPSVQCELHHLLSQKCSAEGSFAKIMEKISKREGNVIMIMSGLLRFEVLKLALMKRWRVNYGVDEKRSRKSLLEGGRKMAIPFKAKDKAAELTEFGHPDVALCFTQLSYYYSGLSDDELDETWKSLTSCHNMTDIYSKWVESIDTDSVDPSIKSLSGINMSDSAQRKLFFSTYRFNMHVCDFYLSKLVFPREAKIFVEKLMCTTWDLCSHLYKHRVTGFSGTNDTKNILPMSVIQNDLIELESTNENVRRTLLSPENQQYMGLEANITGDTILRKLVENEIPVMIDAGALMLEYNNEQVAEKWLALASEKRFDAAVYFDVNDVIQTLDRKGIVTEFECSIYREQLDRCLVYLDDVHTRGTNMKFPIKWKACVTLCGDITRDKTVQACMRMRELGRGQSIAFWASYEANLKIQMKCEATTSHECTKNLHVIEFICDNSSRTETENVCHWAAGAYNYAKKHLGHSPVQSLSALLKACTDDECTELEKMYGDKQEAPLTRITEFKFDKLAGEFPDHRGFIDEMKAECIKKIVKHAPNVKRFVQALDEEQERELEKEKEPEEERHIERLYPIRDATPEFNEKLTSLILQGAIDEIMNDLLATKCIVPFLDGLSNTQFIRDYVNETTAWSNYMFVTKDFKNTTTDDRSSHNRFNIRSNASRTNDQYLRPVWWISRIEKPTTKAYALILFSSFECDRLLPAFKRSKFAALYQYRPKIARWHNSLLHHPGLQISAITNIPRIRLHDEVQVAMYSGATYFSTTREQDGYCNFLGILPLSQKRSFDTFQSDSEELNELEPKISPCYERGAALVAAVGEFNFKRNPTDLATSLIEAHHCSMPEESHVSSILRKGIKLPII